MTQYGFFIDLSRCIGCNACVIACKQWHNIPPGPVKWLRLYQWEKGSFPNIKLNILPVLCFHCENPVCATACTHGAIYKEEKYGAVLVDSKKCKGDRKCWEACPYGVPQFEGDKFGLPMSMCNMCLDRLEKGLKPICVMSCSMRALEFGPMDELRQKYGNLRQIEEMPSDSVSMPSLVLRPASSKKQVVRFDYQRALELWQKRYPDSGEPLPDIFAKISEVTRLPEDITGRNKLVLKAKNSAELMYYTMDDE
jgi:anaerobic dimethyl sulfoxide reductase subunit B (iron-sulfur subunit)